MRTLALVLLVGFMCLVGGFYAGSVAGDRARAASAEAALQRAHEALTVGRRDEALQYAFAALDRDPQLFAAYEVAGDAVATGQPREFAGHYYRGALGVLEKRRTVAAGAEKESAAERARIQAKIAALDR